MTSPSNKPMIPRSQPPRPPHTQSTPAISLACTKLSGSPDVIRRAPSVPVNPSTAAASGSLSSLLKDGNVTQSSSPTEPKGLPGPIEPTLMPPITGQPSTSSSSSNPRCGPSSSVSRGPLGTGTLTPATTVLEVPIKRSPPQTGASRMAAAAKRGLDGSAGNNVKVYEKDHPLNEETLKQRGYQTLNILNHPFHLPNRWKLLRPLGQGAYGLVIQVQDAETEIPIAVKCVTKVFDKIILARRALREITLLKHFGEHDNLTGLVDMDNVWDGYNEIYLYMEPMEADLHQIIRSGQPLRNDHIQFFIYQLLRGMKYIHSANVIHRDLKPGNLLVNSDCELKICDFGLARGFNPVSGEEPQGEEGKLTEYVATRWYRAPEIMLSNRRYTTAIDVWSIGCILAELLGLKPMFKGKDYIEQMTLILETVGTPDEETMARVASEKALLFLKTLPTYEKKDLRSIFPHADPLAVDLTDQLLEFDHTRRIDVPTALKHAYVDKYHDPEDEPSCDKIFDKWEEVESLSTIEELKAAITREIKEFREEVRTAVEEDDEDEEWAERDYLDEEKVIQESPIPGSASTFKEVAYPEHIALTGSAPRTREHSPSTNFTPLAEDYFTGQHGFGGPKGRASRRSSTHSMSGRRPASFLFSPFGAGMTQIVPTPNTHTRPHTQTSPEPMAAEKPPRDRRSSGIWRTRSRAQSQSGNLVLERLSSLEINDSKDGEKNRIDALHAMVGLGGDAEVPPITVSPSDAPASEVPKSFGY
ncbi:CMGC/MAPK protein kinase [Cryptococcus bacillisporus CA1873]|uniref:Mitogen-activated protein kinase n=1 Tax=Cryptococcus bacillisporus CA1873 TaxID=1296111 RepID=A0ABR5BAU3_CRYGA|nr:CMGC/MAPK protein kinase [Cryptococcus bacillisporus CA1873]|eukprot:KIR62502.1 CMGC/MAPK protein kinase [Cryptococcus gattii CA1873]